MPRCARLDAQGLVQHVWARGIARQVLFLDATDCQSFLDHLGERLADGGHGCLAWALLPNHFHLVVRSGPEGLSRLMARVQTAHALHFNRRHERVGHVFQNRFGSRILSGEEELPAVLGYVLGNPLKHRVVPDARALADHPWSGFGAVVGSRSPHPFEDVRSCLSAFGEDPESARLRLHQALPEPVSGQEPGDPDAVLERLAAAAGTTVEVLRGARGRRERGLRARVASCAVSDHGCSTRAVARLLGVAPSSITRARRRSV